MKKILIAACLVVIVSIAGIFAYKAFRVYRMLFCETASFETVSFSPDGMYRCEVRESYTTGQSRTAIKVFQRVGSGDNPWQLVKAEEIANDSACRSNYSVDWQYNEQHQTEGVIVFGDFGSPPFPGEVIFRMRIDSPQKETSLDSQSQPTISAPTSACGKQRSNQPPPMTSNSRVLTSTGDKHQIDLTQAGNRL